LLYDIGGKEPLGRPRRKWVDNIKTDLRQIGRGDMDLIDLAQNRGAVQGSCEHCNELPGSIKCLEILEWLHS
jgi:hypothetical protein